MPLTNFTSKVTKITSTWANKIDALFVTIFGEATTKAEARTALTSDAPMDIDQGGTGATTAPDALTNLGISAFVQTLLDDADSNTVLQTLTHTRAETGASAISVFNLLRDNIFLTPEQFGAVGDGSTDDGTALTNFFNALMSTGLRGRMKRTVYATASNLPNVNVNGFHLEAAGPSSPHDVGTNVVGTVIKKITNSGGTLLTVAPTEGASAQRLDGVVLDGISFDGNSLSAKCLVVKSIRNSRINVYVQESTDTGFEMDVATTLGEATGCNNNEINVTAEHLVNTGVGVRLKGDSTGNCAFNFFRNVVVIHNDGAGIVVENADNNIWLNTQVFRAGGGTGDGVVWQGGSTSLLRARNETFFKLSCNSSLIVKGTGSYTVAAQDIRIHELDSHNYPNVAPTIETGATCYWRDNSHIFIGFSATDASGTSYGAGPTDITFDTETFDPGADFSSPTYTAPMPGKYSFTLRLLHTNGVTVADRWSIKLVTSNRTYSHEYIVTTAQYGTVNLNVLADMDAGDTAKWTITRGAGTGNFIVHADSEYNSFSGYMVEGV